MSRQGYKPTVYQNTDNFYGSLFSPNWDPSPLFCKLCDALFFWLDDNATGKYRQSNRMEFCKMSALSTLLDDKSWNSFSFRVQGAVVTLVYDCSGLAYTLESIEGDIHLPVLDILNHLRLNVAAVKRDPDTEWKDWNKTLQSLKLVDPETGIEFPRPIPRSAFPARGVPDMKIAFDSAVTELFTAVRVQHDSTHRQFTPVNVTMDGFHCDACKSRIPVGTTRYKCTMCFDYDECYGCFHNSPVSSVSNAPPPAYQEIFMHSAPQTHQPQQQWNPAPNKPNVMERIESVANVLDSVMGIMSSIASIAQS